MNNVFSDFRSRVILRVILLGASMSLFLYMAQQPNMLFAAILTAIIVILQLAEIFRFVSQTNRKLTRFLESVKYSDFISGFANDNKLGKSFKDLNIAFNEVLEAFRKARSEKEEHWQYLNTVVQQVRTGILSFDADGNIQLINMNARKFMEVQNLKTIHELKESNPKLYNTLVSVEPGKGALHKGANEVYLTIQATELRIRGNDVKLLTLQNIQARARSPIIWMLANIKQAVLLTTSNRSEGDVGYATMDGDTSGSLAPIAGIDKPFIIQWLKWAQQNLGYTALKQVNEQQPTAELRPTGTNQTDETDLMPYSTLVEIEHHAIRDRKSPVEVFNAMKSNYKDVVALKNHIKKFFKLWAANQWKRERLAPSFHLDELNVDPRSWCRFPILSSGFKEELETLDRL